MAKAQQCMKFYTDKRRDLEFDVGDWVYLKMRPYRQKTLAHRLNEKLGPRFYGPYKISHKVGRVAYRFELPKDCLLHPVFDVSQHKKAEGIVHSTAASPPLTAKLEMNLPPVDVLQVRQLPSKPREVLVLWEGQDKTEATWEDAKKFLA